MTPTIDPQLAALADAHGVAHHYTDARRSPAAVDPEVVRSILGLLGVETGSPAAVRRELAAARERARRLPGTLVVRPGRPAPVLPGPGVLHTEDGHELPVADRLPADLAPGVHRLTVGDRRATVISAPRLPEPPAAWGWMLQLYGLRSAASWGIGDLGDLREMAGRSGADVLLLNPLHAPTPVPPVPASPYSPSSRRFVNPIYLRIADTEAYRRAEPALRERVDALRPGGDAADAGGALIDYDAAWRAKAAALELLWPYAGPVDLDADPVLRDFATYCALAERHGRNWRDWPEALRRPDGQAVTAARRELADRVAFHAWLQRLCADQLGAAQRTATGSGAAVGVVADLAVGVDPGGADAWTFQDVLAEGVRIGAPPDAFNQQGQDWGLATWRPDRLAETGYQGFRGMIQAVLAHAGGVRIDHVAGLWRLWWVPPGGGATDGTYVHYDADAMLAALALEAHRARAVVVGEDLGTVEPVVTEGLVDERMLASAVLWFARDADEFTPPAKWPERAAATVSTHDLPTAAGFLSAGHVDVRERLGLLDDPAADRRQAAADRAALVALLVQEGLAAPDTGDEELVVAMHELLARTPCRLLLASPYDVLGEPRQPNLPGTVDEYPNWRIPLPVGLPELLDDPRVRRVAAVLSAARPRGG